MELFARITNYIDQAPGLTKRNSLSGLLEIHQEVDGKSLAIHPDRLEDVLPRVDADGKSFLQVNFNSSHKILVTDTLIGFKPTQMHGLDMARLPKVVTTPDIISVFEAIQDTLHSADFHTEELRVLRRVFDAVVAGGEAVGFDLALERGWIRRLPANLQRVTA